MVSLVLVGLIEPASACGGTFCNAIQPVVQNAERIVFDVDRANERVEMHVQIFYEGAAEQFAWVVPVPRQPELFVSTDALFDVLGTTTGPIFQRVVEVEGNCAPLVGPLFAAESAAFDAGGDSTGVTVVARDQVGPYETATLQARDAATLVTWLQTNGYAIPENLGAALEPYVADESYFVALRLQKDRDVGSIAPLGLRYAGTEASIPIQLTSVAAADDMRLEVYVFSDQRAVPRSYLHVSINEAAIDWWNGGQNYSDVITLAADEAGGWAFATDYFGPSEPFAIRADVDESALRGAGDAVTWLEILRGQGVPFTNALAELFVRFVNEPVGVDPLQFLQCPFCFDWVPGAFDANAATDAVMVEIVEPLERASALFDRPLLTRMTSSLSASEMTVDPVFVLNPDLSGEADFVPQLRTATEVFECGLNRRQEHAPRRLVLTDGREIELPSQRWFADNALTEAEFLEDLVRDSASQVVEAMDERGRGEVVVDRTAEFAQATAAHNRFVRDLLGCGCTAAAPAPAYPALLVLGLLLVGWRRRA